MSYFTIPFYGQPHDTTACPSPLDYHDFGQINIISPNRVLKGGEAMILALDCATKTGWSLWRDGKLIESGVQDFSKQRGDSNGILFLKFRTWLRHILQEQHIGLVGYEQAHYRGGAATEICVNLTGRVQEICAELKIEYMTVHTMTLKKWVTGSGKADKLDMINKAHSIIGRDPIDDNEADAVLLGKYISESFKE